MQRGVGPEAGNVVGGNRTPGAGLIVMGGKPTEGVALISNARCHNFCVKEHNSNRLACATE